MKLTSFLLLTCILLLGVNLAAQEADSVETEPDSIAWYTDYNQALSTATSEGRYMLVEFFADW